MNKLEKVLYIIFFIALTIFFIKFFLLVLLIVLLLGFLRTWQMQQEPNNKAFLNGALPNPTPDGFYQGDVGFNTSWLGKKFDAENSTGINVFKNKRGVQIEKYPFKTYAGKLGKAELVMVYERNLKIVQGISEERKKKIKDCKNKRLNFFYCLDHIIELIILNIS